MIQVQILFPKHPKTWEIMKQTKQIVVAGMHYNTHLGFVFIKLICIFNSQNNRLQEC